MSSGGPTVPSAQQPPTVAKDKIPAGGKSPVKTAWAAWGREGSSKALIPSVGSSQKYSVNTSSVPSTTTPTTTIPWLSPTNKPPSSRQLTPPEPASPPAAAPSRAAQLSPAKSFKKPPSTRELTQPEPSPSSNPKQQLSPGKSNKDLVSPPPPAEDPPQAPPVASAEPNKPSLETAPPAATLPLGTLLNVDDIPDIETPLGIFGPQFQQRETEDLCFSMGLTVQEVHKLVGVFNEIDTTFTGLINLREFFFLLDTPQNKFTSAILRFGAHKSDPVKLDIDDFVRIVCTFSAMPPSDVYKLCFNTFDEDDSGALSKDEFVVMCDSIQIKGEGFFQGNFRKAMDAFDANHDGVLDFAEFNEMNRKFPLVFWPLFHFQENMRDKILGKRAWKQIHLRQLKIDGWFNYMKRHAGRAPPFSWTEIWCWCLSTDSRLRLIAAQLYDQDVLRLKVQQRRASPGGAILVSGGKDAKQTTLHRTISKGTSSRSSSFAGGNSKIKKPPKS